MQAMNDFDIVQISDKRWTFKSLRLCKTLMQNRLLNLLLQPMDLLVRKMTRILASIMNKEQYNLNTLNNFKSAVDVGMIVHDVDLRN